LQPVPVNGYKVVAGGKLADVNRNGLRAFLQRYCFAYQYPACYIRHLHYRIAASIAVSRPRRVSRPSAGTRRYSRRASNINFPAPIAAVSLKKETPAGTFFYFSFWA